MPHSEQPLLKKTNPVSLLPVEILTAIADQLTRHDHRTCCKVDRHWYAFFRRFLYKSIDISTRERYHTFLTHARQRYTNHHHHHHHPLSYFNTGPGQWVREVSYSHTYENNDDDATSLLSLHDWRELRELCPNMDVLHLNLIGMMQLQQLPVSLFPSLYHLTLDYRQQHDRRRRSLQPIDNGYYYLHREEEEEDDINEYVDDYYDQEIVYYTNYDSAPTLPSSMDRILFRSIPSNLRSLTLQKIFRALRVDHLEMIHQACPTLTDLNLSVEFLCHLLLPPTSSINTQPNNTNYEDDDDATTTTTRDNNKKRKKRGLSLQQLQHLCITTTAPHHGYDAIMTSGWVGYLLSTYPNLGRLKLGSLAIMEKGKDEPMSTMLSSPNNNSYDVVLTRHGLSLDHLGCSIQNALVRFIACLRRCCCCCCCPSSSCSRNPIHPMTTAMIMQPPTRTTPHDYHHRPYYGNNNSNNNNKCTISDIQHALADAPVDLFDIRLKFEHKHPNTNHNNITHLELIGKEVRGLSSSSSSAAAAGITTTSSVSSSDFPHTLNIDMLLTHLPFLRQLNAEAVSLERGQRNTIIHHVDDDDDGGHDGYKKHHPLRAMNLKRSWVCDSALDSVILRCPNLNQLVLVDCSVLLVSPRRHHHQQQQQQKTFSSAFTLYMPNHVMQKIVLQGVSLTDYFGVAFDDYPIRLVQLLTLNALPRYILSSSAAAYEVEGMNDPWSCYTSIIQCHSLDQLIVK